MMSLGRFFFPFLLTAAFAAAEAQSAPDAASTAPKSANDASIMGRRDARVITQKIPAPRGQITDRQGKPFAQTTVAYQVALQYKFDQADRDFVVKWARARLDALPGLVKSAIAKTDDELYDHFRHRRWLPLYVSRQIPADEAAKIEKNLPSGLYMHPVYRRYYPGDESAAHIIGYTGNVGKLPTGPINPNEPMWEESEGRAGLESLFNAELTGVPGTQRKQFDENGNLLLDNEIDRPQAGGTLVTTLNLDWQRRAEKVLRNGCRRGALVVVDVITGEVLVMASRPSFDLNLFTGGISESQYNALKDDPASPLLGRAFQSTYPPASSFKPVVALAALNNGAITKNTEIYCPAAITIGNTVMKNWSKTPEGSINVRRALARSCNPWFYQVGIDIGPTAFLSLARKFGFGDKTGLPLIDEKAGVVPNDEWMLKYEKRRILNGDTANMSIGQGPLLATPLQVAQAMAGIANGGVVPKLQLILQVQDPRGRVVKAAFPERRTQLGLDPKAIKTVREGMADVVSAGYGTGKSGALSYTELCGKTGTGQWKPAKNQNVAWFAGFLPADDPRFAFAVLYEGRPGEKVSGGRTAAPMVRSFFEPLKDDIEEIIAPPKKAEVVGADDDGDGNGRKGVPRAQPVEDPDGEGRISDPEAGEDGAPPHALPAGEPAGDEMDGEPATPPHALPAEGDDDVMDADNGVQ